MIKDIDIKDFSERTKRKIRNFLIKHSVKKPYKGNIVQQARQYIKDIENEL